jgi:hypothetical protein
MVQEGAPLSQPPHYFNAFWPDCALHQLQNDFFVAIDSELSVTGCSETEFSIVILQL